MSERAITGGRARWARLLAWGDSWERLTPRIVLARYPVAWAYLAGFALAGLVSLSLSGAAQVALLNWASTNVTNLRHNPAGSLVVSAFVTSGLPFGSLLLITLAMFGANRAIGNWRLVVACAAGHVIGTAVSESIEYYRIAHGLLPGTDALILDVGPSYIVVSAVVVAIGAGSPAARVAAGLDLLLLIFYAHIFSGLSSLDVAAVGHVTAMTVAVLVGLPLAARYRRAQAQARVRVRSAGLAEGGDEAADHVLG